MKFCNICKTMVKDNDNYCTFCGSKIQSLSELITEKRNEMMSLDNNQNLKENNSHTESLTQDKKIKKNRLILILILIFLLMSIILGFLSENKNDVNHDYKVQTQVNDNNSSKNNFLNENEKLFSNSKQENLIYMFEPTEKNNDDFVQKNEAIKLNGDNKEILNEDMVSNLYDATDKLGMSRDKILFPTLSKDLNGKDLGKFVYNGHKFTAVYGNDNKVSQITNSLNEKIFEDGQVIKQINEFVVSYEDLLDISRVSKMIVNLVHDEPTVSKFPNIISQQYSWNVAGVDDIIVVSSYVDYWNKKGNKIRQDFKILLLKDGDRYKLINLIFDGEKSERIIY